MAELSKRGLLAVLVCSEPFEGLARAQARRLGAPELSLLVIPHPLGGIALEQVRERAEAASAGLLQFLKDHLA